MLHPPATTEPLGEVIQHYTNTLCSAKKQTNLTTSLIQDIPVCNGHDATHLEDWLVDIEMAADLTAEGRTKHAQAKSRCLPCTLITRAIMSGHSWDDIKDLLQLNICNSDIHTSISHIMEIQQREKESLAAYIHWFKTETKRCNFPNNTATIRIFIKGLKNTHSLAACIYKKGPQTLTEVPGCTTTYSHINTILNGKHYVSGGRSVFSVPGIGSYGTLLSQCSMF